MYKLLKKRHIYVYLMSDKRSLSLRISSLRFSIYKKSKNTDSITKPNMSFQFSSIKNFKVQTKIQSFYYETKLYIILIEMIGLFSRSGLLSVQILLMEVCRPSENKFQNSLIQKTFGIHSVKAIHNFLKSFLGLCQYSMISPNIFLQQKLGHSGVTYGSRKATTPWAFF